MENLSHMNLFALQEMREVVSFLVSEKRYAHILRVEEEIAKLGELYLPSKCFDLRVAAILHDITKDLSLKEQLHLCEKFDIILPECISSEILHAKTGAYYAREKFPSYVTDEIFNSIKSHTTGDEEMSLFDKLLFVADYTENGRTYQKCIEVRNRLWNSVCDMEAQTRVNHLDSICVEILDNTILYLIKEKKQIDEKTFFARNALINCKSN